MLLSRHQNAEQNHIVKIVSEYSITKAQGNQVGQKWNGIYQLLVYADDVNIRGDNIYTMKKSI
jgi:hypothetical protein